ncbi:ABC transporter substrate-binding protein [Clostridium grantii]|uniref:Polar amino acid transport system substrate-binding protein n=1 Tax=Clostridium grantii DSM 8605 TaxID=1121316 RepID=A0A1M5V5V8_9CLOT|nr:ABC transporter substrate-binding protein [Clostridium grantii]SHH70629.1 polar amino acid transport system substrate-binding protein [Clostridium grantii DSM 8605]
MIKRFMYLIMTGILLFVLTACGSSSKTTYENIIEDKEMNFAMTGAYPPFNFIDDNGDLTGFDIDIANAIANELGVKAKPITTAWDGIIAGLTGKKFDMIIGSMSITEERLKEVNFTSPYYYDGAQFFAMKGSGLNSIEELKDGKVGVVTGTTFHDALKEMGNIKEILQFESDVDNIMAAEQKRSDGLVTGKFVGLQAPQKYSVDLEPIGPLLYAEEIGIAIRKDDTKLLEEVNAALKKIIEDGTYEEISDKWFGVNILNK